MEVKYSLIHNKRNETAKETGPICQTNLINGLAE